jgi:hypothetical protein
LAHTSEDNAAYYAAHRDERMAYNAIYRATNREACRARGRAHYAANRDRVLAAQRSQYDRVSVDLRALKLLRGCIDCGYDANADALEFDHVRGTKAANVNATLKPRALAIEIAKCEVRCANCHSIATHARGQYNVLP